MLSSPDVRHHPVTCGNDVTEDIRFAWTKTAEQILTKATRKKTSGARH
jgi:hypothetical protein